MLNSDIKAVIRTFQREKAYAIINLSGLSLAIACSLILGLYLKSELTYDRHNKRHKEIYRVVNEYVTSGNTKRSALTAVTLGPMLARDYPEIKDSVRIGKPERCLIRSGGKAFFWDRVCTADTNIFDVFTHGIIYGNPETDFKDPSSVAVSETFAKKYFGYDNPIGKTIYSDRLPSATPRKITVVFQDLPENTHLKYDVLCVNNDHMDEEGRRHMLLYPALYLSSIAPLSVMKKTSGEINRKLPLKEILVLVQFTVSAIVIACTLLMFMQMRFVSNKPLGFEKTNRLVIPLQGLDVIEKFSVAKKELLTNSHIRGVAITQTEPGTGIGTILNSRVENKNGSMGEIILKFVEAGDDFIEVMGMTLVSGRDFSRSLSTDEDNRFIVNEATVKKVGWSNPLGKRIIVGGLKGRVIGVVKDFNFESLHRTVEPIALRQFSFDFSYLPPELRTMIQEKIILHISGNDVKQTLEFLKRKFAEFDSKNPFEYEFLDNMIDRLYMPENRLMKMAGIFSAICIFISCLGVFGLAAINTEQRSREIGIRKVLGASANQIILMLASKILWLVLAGSILASLVAYYAMDEWLSGFAYRAGINPLVFFVSVSVVIAVAFATIALQSYKIATANPSDMMHCE